MLNEDEIKINKSFLYCLVLSYLMTIEDEKISEKIIIPKITEFEKEESFDKFETEFIKLVQLYNESNIDLNIIKQLNVFITDWVSANNRIPVKLNYKIYCLFDHNPALQSIYLGNYATEYLEHNDTASLVSATIVGLKAIIKIYLSEAIFITKTNAMDDLVENSKNSDFEEFIILNYIKK